MDRLCTMILLKLICIINECDILLVCVITYGNLSVGFQSGHTQISLYRSLIGCPSMTIAFDRDIKLKSQFQAYLEDSVFLRSVLNLCRLLYDLKIQLIFLNMVDNQKRNTYLCYWYQIKQIHLKQWEFTEKEDCHIWYVTQQNITKKYVCVGKTKKLICCADLHLCFCLHMLLFFSR